MRPPALARIALEGGAAGALAAVPVAPGVGQLLGAGERNLLIGTASNLRRWAASHLGLDRPRPAPPGARARRPRTSLAGVATAIAWMEADGPFRQRLLYERLSASQVPPPSRRDLKPPFFVHLDPQERFPRATVRGAGEGPLYGPFRDRRAAEAARGALQRLFALRPCDYSFEPDPALPLGLACLYAQVRSCAAQCLARVSEADYRGRAALAASWLADSSLRRDAPPAVPQLVAASSSRALIVDAGKRSVGLYPLRRGRVLDAAALVVAPDALDAAVGRLEWPEPEAPDDWPWLTAWLASPKRRASYLLVRDADSPEELRVRVRGALPAALAALATGGNVGASREEA